MENTQLIKVFDVKSLKKLSKNYSLSFVILFGSYITNKQKKSSDIDIAIYKPNLSIEEEIEIREEISKLTQKSIDIINIENPRIVPSLLFEIAYKGKVLVQNNTLHYNLFKEQAYFFYNDSKELLKSQLEYIKKGVKW